MIYMLSLFYFFYFAIVGIYIIFMPKVLIMLSYSASEIGIIFGAAPLIRFLLPFTFKKLIKLNAQVFRLATFIMLLSAVMFYFSLSNFYALFFSNIGLGIGMSVILPFVESLALDYIGKERYGKIRLFGSVGFVLVALLLVRFLSSPEIAVLYLLVTTLVTALIAFFLISMSKKAEKEQEGSMENDIQLLGHYKLWVSLMLMQMSFGAYYNFFTIYETAQGISLDMTVNLWVFGVLVEIFMLFFQGRFLRKNLLSILEVTIFSTVIRWLLLFLFPQNLLILVFSQSLHALSFALFYSASISYLHQLYKSKVLAQQFYSGITFGLGGFVGAILFGYIYQYFPAYIFLLASFIALLSLISIYYWKKEYNVVKKSRIIE